MVQHALGLFMVQWLKGAPHRNCLTPLIYAPVMLLKKHYMFKYVTIINNSSSEVNLISESGDRQTDKFFEYITIIMKNEVK